MIDSIRRELTEAGLANVAVHRGAQELQAPSFDKFWSAMERTNAPLVLIKHRLGPERAERPDRVPVVVRAGEDDDGDPRARLAHGPVSSIS